jgi:hypothetical protein
LASRETTEPLHDAHHRAIVDNLIIVIIIIIIIAMDSPSPNDLITSRSANYLNKRELSASQGVERFHGQVGRLWAIIIIERRRHPSSSSRRLPVARRGAGTSIYLRPTP